MTTTKQTRADKIRADAAQLGYESLTVKEKQAAIVGLAAKHKVWTQEVLKALTRKPSKGRNPKPCCPTCGQTIRKGSKLHTQKDV